MLATKTKTELEGFLKLFTETHKNRPTRLGVFEEGRGAVIDYWLEDDLPLVGVDLDAHGDRIAIQILLEHKPGTGNGHFTHTVGNVRSAKFMFNFDGQSDGLDILDFEGNTTILRFEDF